MTLGKLRTYGRTEGELQLILETLSKLLKWTLLNLTHSQPQVSVNEINFITTNNKDLFLILLSPLFKGLIKIPRFASHTIPIQTKKPQVHSASPRCQREGMNNLLAQCTDLDKNLIHLQNSAEVFEIVILDWIREISC